MIIWITNWPASKHVTAATTTTTHIIIIIITIIIIDLECRGITTIWLISEIYSETGKVTTHELNVQNKD